MHKIKINVNNGERRSAAGGGVSLTRRTKMPRTTLLKGKGREGGRVVPEGVGDATAAICCCSLLVFACTYAK